MVILSVPKYWYNSSTNDSVIWQSGKSKALLKTGHPSFASNKYDSIFSIPIIFADFINCVAFGKSAEFAEKYLHRGTKIAITGRIQTGSYTNKDGQKVYTTDVVVDNVEFAESKNASDAGSFDGGNSMPSAPIDGGFMNIPDGIDEELPFN